MYGFEISSSSTFQGSGGEAPNRRLSTETEESILKQCLHTITSRGPVGRFGVSTCSESGETLCRLSTYSYVNSAGLVVTASIWDSNETRLT